jgi:branched-subunit amino acid permease
MPLSSSNAVRQLSDANSQGTILGQSATDLIGFYGATTGVARMTLATLSTAVSSTGAFGFGDAGTASSIVAALEQLRLMGLFGT